MKVHMYGQGAVLAIATLAAVGGFAFAMALASTPNGLPDSLVRPIVSANATQAPRAVTEDSPGWDCLRQGNATCRIDGVLMTSLEGMPSDPFGRCVFLLGISRRVDPDGLTYVDQACEPIRQQLG